MRGFLGLVLLFIVIPFALKAAAYSSARSDAEADTAATFVLLSRSRFFEANLRQSFLAVLASARGATPAQVAQDAAEKLARWASVAFEASERRGLVPSLWVGCGAEPSKHVDFFAGDAKATFSKVLSFDSNQSVLKVKYWGNDSAIEALGCAKVDVGLGLESANSSQLFIFGEGLYSTSNLTDGQVPAFGFEN
ncbi:MAG: hypothetical protein WCX64_00690 [Candidatus Micrarchaeia archaeon]|jgi:hypothetical protein